jgi:hypothetical protein
VVELLRLTLSRRQNLGLEGRRTRQVAHW